MADASRPGTRTRRDRPPPKAFLGIGAAFLGINHLSVVLNFGVQAEALVMGCWLVLMGGWVLVAGRSFDAVWAWADRVGWRVIGFMLLSLVAALGAAAAVAWYGYGERLVG